VEVEVEEVIIVVFQVHQVDQLEVILFQHLQQLQVMREIIHHQKVIQEDQRLLLDLEDLEEVVLVLLEKF
jgi:hypothetical protein